MEANDDARDELTNKILALHAQFQLNYKYCIEILPVVVLEANLRTPCQKLPFCIIDVGFVIRSIFVYRNTMYTTDIL